MKAILSEYAIIILGIIWIIFGFWIIAGGLFSPPPVIIHWSTETEFETAGFNIYRSDSSTGTFTQVNAQLIPAQANAASGANYTWEDTTAENGKVYYYQLEDVEYSNSRTRHEPFRHKTSNDSVLKIAISLSALVFGLALTLYGRIDLRRKRNAKKLTTSTVSH